MYSRPTLSTLRQQAITDITTAMDAVPLPQSILRVLGTAEAGLAYELFAYLDYISKMSIPVTATAEYLESWANLKGCYRLPATAASGLVVFAGSTGTVVPAGTTLATTSQVQYRTSDEFVVGVTAQVRISAVTPGIAGNAASGISLAVLIPIAGLTSSLTTSTALIGGADQEDDQSLRARMLAIYQQPPNGGSANDYIEWCREVPGCTRAWVNQLGLGAGSVGLWVMFDSAESAFGGFPQGDDGGSQYETRIAAATGDKALVADHIYNLRPVTALVAVYGPVPVPVNVMLQGLLPGTAAVQDGIQQALADLFVRKGSPLPGNAIYLSDVNEAINSVAGIVHFDLLVPSLPITVPTGSLPVVGTITYIA